MNSTPSDSINSQPDMFSFTVPITVFNHRVAEKFYQQHSDLRKAKQVYLNTLSVQAVNFYLMCLGIKTNLEQSQSWNTVLQALVDTADLWVDGLGHLECRPILSDVKTCFVPAQVWSDSPGNSSATRIGYVVVQLNSELTEATLLGFVPKVETEHLLLEQLQSLDQLPEYLNHLATISAELVSTQSISTQSLSTQSASTQSAFTVLSQWLHHAIETTWQPIEMLLEDLQIQPALSFRSPITALHLSEQPSTGVKRGKFLVLENTLETRVLFLIEIIPETAFEYHIKMELYPAGEEVYLPRSLHVSVLDESGKTVLQAENSNSEGLEFQFSGEIGEQFSVKVSLNECNIVEAFEI